ncbi:hypothetical protein [Methylobacterium nodulans]|uniref:Uncharacterized protein n=1 Tax=Methylobacterium nodulans (strain LMG 21967 / CNCM I-2342 / ORS 2060) TaxID=460265 RepID=B8IW99_METNO|nr:hypothetical protein [Methylobacterium nodulans]ACL62689.1 hypothetical protein Mnod_8610 [Methylobacterium nodulans ORS 2060]
MDEKPRISVEAIEFAPIGQDQLSADITVQFGGPQQGFTMHGVVISDSGEESLNWKLAVVEAKRLARFFGTETTLTELDDEREAPEFA